MHPAYQDPPLPGEPTPEDLAAFQAPMDGMVTTPDIPVKAPSGVGFDFSIINVQTQEEYDAKPPEIQHLIHEIKQLGVLPSQEWAANRVVEIQKEIATRNSPEARARAEKAQLDLEKSEAEVSQIAARKEAAMSEISNMRAYLKDLKDHPGMSSSIGAKGIEYNFGMAKEPYSGTKAADFYSLLEQVQGGTFMQAFNNLKGGGQITEQEGAKATAAIARLNPRQSEAGFLKALEDFDTVLAQAQSRAGAPPQVAPVPQAAPQPTPQPQSAPATRVIGGKTFIQQPNGNWIPR